MSKDTTKRTETLMEPNATETIVETIAPLETLPPEQDTEAQLAELQAEKAKLSEERDNYKNAYLKEAQKNKGDFADESEEDKFRRIAREELAATRLGEIDKQEKELLAKALKENKELKLAQLNKTTTPPVAMGTHSEGIAPTDTRVTPEQLAYFKCQNWTDKDIARYKRNLAKNTR